MPIVRPCEKQISYWIGRSGLSRERETVLFIHGAGGGAFAWSYQKRFFEERFNPIIIELPGHGESGGEGEGEIEKYVGHVHSFLKVLGLEKIFLVGHSMGGAIVQAMALSHPEMVRGVVLVGTGVRLKVFPMILNGIRDHFEEIVRKMAPMAYSHKTPRDLVEQGIRELMRCSPEVVYGDFLACDRFDVMKEVEKIDLPALILCGEEDELTPVRYSEFLHRRIRGSRLEVLPNAGHMVMMESPDAFNQKVAAFIVDEGGKESRVPGFKDSSG
jgi:pimeloyl-ACP methyl ester carboxylesterase